MDMSDKPQGFEKNIPPSVPGKRDDIAEMFGFFTRGSLIIHALLYSSCIQLSCDSVSEDFQARLSLRNYEKS